MRDSSLLTYSFFYAVMLIYCGRFQIAAREFPYCKDLPNMNTFCDWLSEAILISVSMIRSLESIFLKFYCLVLFLAANHSAC